MSKAGKITLSILLFILALQLLYVSIGNLYPLTKSSYWKYDPTVLFNTFFFISLFMLILGLLLIASGILTLKDNRRARKTVLILLTLYIIFNLFSIGQLILNLHDFMANAAKINTIEVVKNMQAWFIKVFIKLTILLFLSIASIILNWKNKSIGFSSPSINNP